MCAESYLLYQLPCLFLFVTNANSPTNEFLWVRIFYSFIYRSIEYGQYIPLY